MGWAKSECTLKVEKAVLRYYEEKPGVISLDAAFHFRAGSKNIFHDECLIYKAKLPGHDEPYPIFRVKGPAQLTGQGWGMGQRKTFEFQSQPVTVIGPKFELSNTLDFPADAAQRKGKLEMVIDYQWVDDKGISDVRQLIMIVPYDLDTRRSKKSAGKKLTADEIILMPATVAFNIIKLVLCPFCDD